MLPTYTRPGDVSLASSFVRRLFRSSEKCLILLVFVTLVFICFGGVFYLPDDFGAGERVLKVYQHLQKAPEMFIPAPPLMGHVGVAGPLAAGPGAAAAAAIMAGGGGSANAGVLEQPYARRAIGDRAKLNAKIEEELGREMLEKPEAGGAGDAPMMNAPPAVGGAEQALPPPLQQQQQQQAVGAAPEVGQAETSPASGFVNGEDSDPKAREQRNKVKEMMSHSWNNYKLYAWGKNELKPLSKRPHIGSIFGSYELGATIIDGLDTLYLMGMTKEFEEGREWIARRFTFDNISADLSVFETNIRYVGGLLSCYALTGDPMFKDKAAYVADKLMPAFQTPTGIPNAIVNLRTGASKNYGWASSSSSILSEFGTLHLEFAYLSDITGNPMYRERVQNVRQILYEMEKPKGLYPNYLNPVSGKWGQLHMSLGALGDSFYEYLLKAWIQSGQTDTQAREMYDEAMAAIKQHMIRTSPNGLTYVSDLKFDHLDHKMDHLACFSGGLFALGAHTQPEQPHAADYMAIGAGLTNTCHESYIRTATHLGPEAFRFTEGAEAKALKTQEKYYILRPETFESYFIMWRLTHDQKYRDWGWDAVQALERHCRSANGFSGLKNVYLEDPQKDDVQQSFFLAETLKYLYLLFSDDSVLPLEEWTFNTEAHPLPVKGANPLYRMAATTQSQSTSSQ